jgi:hypothetical protein
LVVDLPDKYPGQPLEFAAKSFAGTMRVIIAHRHDKWPLEIAVDAGRTWSYHSSDQLTFSTLGFQLTFGRTVR